MSNVGYDLDTSGGLMPLIRALIKPPDEEANGQKSRKQQHPYYKRPGKGHNHDSCDACGEGGDLICCDRCPASFHLGCYDPPLSESDIPTGLWLCRECRASDDVTSKSSRAHSPSADSTVSKEGKKRTLRTKKSKEDRDDVSESSKKSDDAREKDKDDLTKEKEDLTPMEVLVRAARVMNPKQFELPREMSVPCMFPGVEKEGPNPNAILVTVDAQGLVPLPAKTCYVCTGTCKVAPLLQCDYCPLLFHLDCLDPPLTALPTGRWMCPNHVEQYIDWKLVNSISCTERVALWDRFSGPVDQHAIKVDFIRRARNKHPCFRVKVPVGVRGRVAIPEAVQSLYANPPSLLPSRREATRCYRAMQNLKNQNLYSEDEDGPVETVCLNTACPQYSGAGPCPRADPASVSVSASAPLQGVEADLAAIQKKPEKDPESSDLSDSDFEYLTASVKRRKMAPEDNVTVKGRIQLKGDAEAAKLLEAVDQQLEKLDERLVKLLAWQRLQQVLTGEQCSGLWKRVPLSPACEAVVSGSVDRQKLAKHGFRNVALPSQLLTRYEREKIAQSVFGALEHVIPPAPVSPGHSLSDCMLRATLSPVTRHANGLGDTIGRPLAMRLSRATVGTDSGCDIVLSTTCRRVSQRHAVIFCDEVSRHFELINYSEWGSRVNGVVYACDLTPPAPAPSDLTPPAPAPSDKDGDIADAVKHIARKRTPKAIQSSSSDCLCPCKPYPTGPAWEGSAIVPHGALLQFGCHMYVFSIVDPPNAHTHRN